MHPKQAGQLLLSAPLPLCTLPYFLLHAKGGICCGSSIHRLFCTSKASGRLAVSLLSRQTMGEKPLFTEGVRNFALTSGGYAWKQSTILQKNAQKVGLQVGAARGAAIEGCKGGLQVGAASEAASEGCK